jgi:hypothetical protein
MHSFSGKLPLDGEAILTFLSWGLGDDTGIWNELEDDEGITVVRECKRPDWRRGR